MLLDVPPVMQCADYDCGAAAVDCVAQFWGLRPRGPAKFSNRVQGMSPDTVEALLRALGLSVLSGNMTVDDLKHLTRTGRPVLCPVDLYGGHWVVVRGVGRGKVHYHCPTDGPGSMPAKDWAEKWKDVSRGGQEFVRFGICPGR